MPLTFGTYEDLKKKEQEKDKRIDTLAKTVATLSDQMMTL
jgi:hypothetical protein